MTTDLQLHRAHPRRDPPKGQGHRPAPWPDQLPHPGLGRPGPGLPRLARIHHDLRRPAAPARPAPLPARTTPQLRPQTITTAPPDDQHETVRATAESLPEAEPCPPIYTGFRTPPWAGPRRRAPGSVLAGPCHQVTRVLLWANEVPGLTPTGDRPTLNSTLYLCPRF